jgi:plastocyanin
MKDFMYVPQTVNASTSQPITLVNAGANTHNFSIAGTSVSVDVPSGQTMTVAAPGPSFQPGTYMIFCRFHRSLGMTGTLVATSG